MNDNGRILAIDYGKKRTGLAISDKLGIIANPLSPISTSSPKLLIDEIASIIEERNVKTIVCGIPYLPNGEEGEQVVEVRSFLSALQTKVKRKINFAEIDERHTTKEAENMWRQVGFNKAKAKNQLDSTAAVIILREFLETR